MADLPSYLLACGNFPKAMPSVLQVSGVKRIVHTLHFPSIHDNLKPPFDNFFFVLQILTLIFELQLSLLMAHFGCPMPLFSFRGAVFLVHSKIPPNLTVLSAFISLPGSWWPSCYCEFVVFAKWSELKLYFLVSPHLERTLVLLYFLPSWPLLSFFLLLVHSLAPHRSFISIFVEYFEADLHV